MGSEGPEDPMDAEEAAFHAAGRRLRWGVLLTGLVWVGLQGWSGLPFRENLAMALFLVLLPTLAVAQTPFLGRIPLERMSAYLSSGLSILGMGGLALFLVWRGHTPEAAGIVGLPLLPMLGWVLLLVAAGLLLSVALTPLERRLWHRNEGVMEALIPRTGEERRLFAGLSLAAGWGEEMAYRAYLPAALTLLGFPGWWAVVAASMAFGILHAYQGPLGVVRTGLLGFLMGASVLLSGSVFPAMVAHALLDLILGLVLAPRLLKRAPLP